MLYGSSVKESLLIKNKRYRDLLIENFAYLYVDSGFDGLGQVKKAKKISEFALDNNKILRGNHLISNLSTRKYPKEAFDRVIESKLRQFPEISEWECVHEVIADSGRFRKNWSQSQIEECFLIAKNYSPGTTLFYADYYRDGRKWRKLYEFLYAAKLKEVPVDGISVQLMSNLVPPVRGNPLSLNIWLALNWIRKIKRDFPEMVIVAPETVVWQPEKILSKKHLIKKSPPYIRYDRKKEWIRKYAIGLMLQPYNIDLLQYQGYKIIIEALIPECKMIGFWSAFDAAPWNWIGNRCKAGLWDEGFNPKLSAQLLLNTATI
ncbi:MAG: endo-1,4-beta-xylanase [Coleofasciculus sp. G1-WW12-02]|uniref:endo-1,4-beta-xylanase n=1 Tax=Coleofasciculus sp. G1-WW12-02 TaxID=3068483 RepID=UPI0032FD3135